MAARRGGYWAAVVVSAVVAAGGVLLAVPADRGSSGPDGVVRAYFAALARSDAPAALALADSVPGPHGFLTSDVLALQQRLAPLTGVHIAGIVGAGVVRTVRYSYVLGFADGARTETGDVDVRQDGDAWRLVAGAVPVHIDLSGASGRATLAGAAVPDGTVALFPGAVPVRFDTADLELASGAVTFGASPEVTLDVAVSAAGRAALQRAVASRMRSCFPTGAASPPSCPLPDDPRIVPGSLRGTIDTAAVDHLDYAVESLASGSIRVDGTLTFTGRFERLDADDIAREHSGRLAVHVRAITPSVGTVRLTLLDASS